MASDELLQEWQSMQLSYAGGRGGAELRAEVAQLYETIEAADVLSCVPDEGIFLGLMALLEPGAEVIVTCPAYASLYEIAHAQGCTVRHWLPAVAAEGEVGRAEGELFFSPAELRGLITPKTGLVVVNFPHNPTGALPTRPEHEAIVSCCREHKLVLFSDVWTRKQPP
jgi:aspartate/methionine/tyrosine aminotransferase